MKKIQPLKKILGVTLLEIMLVLAVAALVIVMSIRFYQSASTSSKVNAGVSTINAIVAAGENYFNAKGTYTGISGTLLEPYLPGQVMPLSPWGGAAITVTSSDATHYVIEMPYTGATGVCTQLSDLLKTNKKFTDTPPECTAGANAGTIKVTVSSY